MSDGELMKEWQAEFVRTTGKRPPNIALLANGEFDVEGLRYVYGRREVRGWIRELKMRCDFEEDA